jgi:hypothetical protein
MPPYCNIELHWSGWLVNLRYGYVQKSPPNLCRQTGDLQPPGLSLWCVRPRLAAASDIPNVHASSQQLRHDPALEVVVCICTSSPERARGSTRVQRAYQSRIVRVMPIGRGQRRCQLTLRSRAFGSSTSGMTYPQVSFLWRPILLKLGLVTRRLAGDLRVVERSGCNLGQRRILLLYRTKPLEDQRRVRNQALRKRTNRSSTLDNLANVAGHGRRAI